MALCIYIPNHSSEQRALHLIVIIINPILAFENFTLMICTGQKAPYLDTNVVLLLNTLVQMAMKQSIQCGCSDNTAGTPAGKILN